MTRYPKTLFVVFLTIQIVGCRYYDEHKQFMSYKDMQIISQILVETTSKQGLDIEAMTDIVLRFNGGKDAWGRDYIIHIDEASRSFALVSLGSDGKPDLNSPDEYFALESRTVHDNSRADLVFINDRAITDAGK